MYCTLNSDKCSLAVKKSSAIHNCFSQTKHKTSQKDKLWMSDVLFTGHGSCTEILIDTNGQDG